MRTLIALVVALIVVVATYRLTTKKPRPQPEAVQNVMAAKTADVPRKPVTSDPVKAPEPLAPTTNTGEGYDQRLG